MHFKSNPTALGAMPQALAFMLNRDQGDQVDQVAQAEPVRKGLARRTFLKFGAGAGGGFALGLFPAQISAQAAPASPGAPALPAHAQPQAFVRIAPDGAVTVVSNRLEMGQGISTGLAMILAEELDADWRRVSSVHGDAGGAYVDPLFGFHTVGGSNSIKNSYTQYRQLGARTRAMLLAAAAAHWGMSQPSSELRTQAGRVLHADGRSLGYGELAEAAMRLPVPTAVGLKDPKEFRLIGRATGRLDALATSQGSQTYGIDVRLPGMLSAVVARPPVFGAKVLSLDDKAALLVRGVKAVLRIPLAGGAEGVAVVAQGYWAAKQGRDALVLSWDDSGLEKVDSAELLARYQALAKTPGKMAAAKHFQADMSALAGAPLRISAEYSFPYLAHAPMEPLNCTVSLSGAGAEARAELWLGSQTPGMDVAAAAAVLGLPAAKIQLHGLPSGGGFGRRANPTQDYVAMACQVAKLALAAGLRAPIQTLWSREDDIQGGYYRPAHLHRAEIGFDAQGRVLAWEHVIVGQSLVMGTPFEDFFVKNGVDSSTTEGMRQPYALPMQLSVHHPRVNVPVLWWRSVGSTHTAYVMETLIDEIARTTGQDPVTYRLGLMGEQQQRHRAALQLAVQQSGYGRRKLAKGRAWGVALHESFDSVVAYVVEASLSKGVPKLHSVTAGVHCNLAVNPKSVEAQVQGAALMGLGMCLPGAAITLKNGRVQQSNFGDYAVARITDMPQIQVHIVPSAEPPTGMGEPGLPPLAPAFANAIARLSGKTPRSLPFAAPVA